MNICHLVVDGNSREPGLKPFQSKIREKIIGEEKLVQIVPRQYL